MVFEDLHLSKRFNRKAPGARVPEPIPKLTGNPGRIQAWSRSTGQDAAVKDHPVTDPGLEQHGVTVRSVDLPGVDVQYLPRYDRRLEPAA